MSTNDSSTNESLLVDFHHVATIGATDGGGVERQAGTLEDKHVRAWFTEFAELRGWDAVSYTHLTLPTNREV